MSLEHRRAAGIQLLELSLAVSRACFSRQVAAEAKWSQTPQHTGIPSSIQTTLQKPTLWPPSSDMERQERNSAWMENYRKACLECLAFKSVFLGEGAEQCKIILDVEIQRNLHHALLPPQVNPFYFHWHLNSTLFNIVCHLLKSFMFCVCWSENPFNAILLNWLVPFAEITM